MTEKTIPLLPCQSRLLQPVVDFYTALGFELTFHQKSPYAYAVVSRGEVELQFFGIKEYDPAEAYSGCYILTDDVDGLYDTFRAGLRKAYGKVPSRGLPRIGPLKNMSYGVRQFLLTDPTGNSIRVGQPFSEDGSHRPVPRETYARALHLADLYVDSKQDLLGAAKIVDHALERAAEAAEAGTGAGPTPVQRLRLLVLRADVAQRLGEDGAADRLERAAAIDPAGFTDEERAEAADSLARLAELTEPG
ncbi:bleomycin resistance protein [Streptomyces clavuligerus]|uniref:Bleomycin resistance protein n=1 Tax=Streptomyces clavuligerus TaxID=1901 RepID=E2Q8K8_STRCL|nr:VOC family protein [Streptomyces clavuligerus]ANW19668.1 bleomycin resistance protein [Streptomyces clavuligerus]AXU14281.1 VOC family protein [Streptomyces clavuligerus]EFG07496.1 Hypothetical protein SCLAV_2423 [Streptomyces clavuligerus]MBY6304283.1 VOC family protein [Streptomyces clavuligerus]QCS07055.1 VOC family protein [Streptomyces clavuligerus]